LRLQAKKCCSAEPYHEEEEDQDLLQIDIGWESIEEPEIYMDAQVFDNNIPGEQEDEQRRAGLLNAPDLEEPYHERGSRFASN
jgi:hypothetical protein